MTKGRQNKSINSGYGSTEEVEMKSSQKEDNEPDAFDSSYVAFSSLHPPRTFRQLFIYALTHAKLSTLPSFPLHLWHKKRQERANYGRLLNEALDEIVVPEPNLLSDATLPAAWVSLLKV